MIHQEFFSFSVRCENIIQHYSDYSYEVQGVGEPPTEFSNLGCCSQLATFTLNEVKHASDSISDYSEEPYKLVSRFFFFLQLQLKVAYCICISFVIRSNTDSCIAQCSVLI